MRTKSRSARVRQIRYTRHRNADIWKWLTNQSNLTESVYDLIKMAQSVGGNKDWRFESQALAMQSILHRYPRRQAQPAPRSNGQPNSSAELSRPSNPADDSEPSQSDPSSSSDGHPDSQSSHSGSPRRILNSDDIANLTGGK